MNARRRTDNIAHMLAGGCLMAAILNGGLLAWLAAALWIGLAALEWRR